ncbi:unnamed protein product [Mytilus coruscus]|uniref:MAM domain-containing protein n=1 Tax=Mytilus coruscus TaxID=42192 RepID=A0A6J8C147_MYTCO|nr:unnamed protein product [Mytilus coruscus]
MKYIGSYRIAFRAIRGNGYKGDIAVDDISLTNTTCKKALTNYSQTCLKTDKLVTIPECSKYYLQFSKTKLIFDQEFKDCSAVYQDIHASTRTICNERTNPNICTFNLSKVERKRPGCFLSNRLLIEYKCIDRLQNILSDDSKKKVSSIDMAKSPSTVKTIDNTENEVDSAETETQPQILETQQIPQIQDIDFLDDSFNTQISTMPNCDFENFLSTISEENLNLMAEQNAKFNSRFVKNDENERATFIEQRDNLNTIRKMNSAVKTFQQYLINVKREFREIHTRVGSVPSRIFLLGYGKISK